jgi:hypothetical protein
LHLTDLLRPSRKILNLLLLAFNAVQMATRLLSHSVKEAITFKVNNTVEDKVEVAGETQSAQSPSHRSQIFYSLQL